MSKTNGGGVLTKDEIISRIKDGSLKFSPNLDEYQIQSHSIDLRLGFTFMVPKYWKVTSKGRVAIQSDYTRTKENFEIIELEPGQYFDILPGEYIIFSALESIALPDDIMAILYPRSSVNRRGLSVDLSGVIDAGYDGQLIIPVRNNTYSQTIRVYPGERFCQLVLHPLSKSVETKKSRFHRKDVALTVGSQSETDSDETKLVREGKITELKKQNAVT